MTQIQFGFTMPADQLDKAQRTTFVDVLNRALKLVHGHFDSARFIDHLQFGDTDVLEGFTALSYMAALHPQLKFGHTVLCQSFRNPALLAKMGATLQFLSGGSGQVIPGTSFLSLIYVRPDRWGKGIGGMMLDAVIDEANRRGCHRISLWTHERQNERAHRLYRSRSFAPTGRTMRDDEGKPIGEWCCDCERT
jgi:GNAT superfamily N-acetyltransferase